MHTGKVGGNLDPIIDPATGQMIEGKVFGEFVFQMQGDPGQAQQWLQSQLLHSINMVLGEKLATNQVALPTLEASLPHLYPEIIAGTDTQSVGAQITQLSLKVVITSPKPAQPAMPPAGAMPPTPQQATANAFQQAAQDHLDPSNYEVEARINVGGFRINASTDGGLDEEGLVEQAKDKAKSTVIWWGIGCVIIGIVILGLAGLGWYIYAEWKSSSAASSTGASGKSKVVKWDGKSPYSCGGNDKVTIKGTKATLKSGVAVKAGANCKLLLDGVTISAPTGIQAMANAVVTVKGGSVTGSSFAAKAMANGKIVFQGTKVKGKKKAVAPAKITGP